VDVLSAGAKQYFLSWLYSGDWPPIADNLIY